MVLFFCLENFKFENDRSISNQIKFNKLKRGVVMIKIFKLFLILIFLVLTALRIAAAA